MKPKVKICGITRLQDAQLSYDLGAWALGFVFYKKSQRFITKEEALSIKTNLKLKEGRKLKWFGVFVDEPKESVEKIDKLLDLDYLQFHGDEPLEYLKHFKEKSLKAFRVKDSLSSETLKDILPHNGSEMFLLDTFNPLEHGGSGKTFDWSIAKSLSSDFKIILAGGISEANINQAFSEVSPYAIDLSSSVEDSKGIKSEQKLKRLFTALKDIT